MIDQDEARARVLSVLKPYWGTNAAVCEKIADQLLPIFYAPRTRLREVVAPSGKKWRVNCGVLYLQLDNGNWLTNDLVPFTDCAAVADLQARPTEEVPS